MHATEMWKHFDKKVVEEDFKGLKAAGVTVLRVFPRWSDFQPLTVAYTTDRNKLVLDRHKNAEEVKN